MAPRPRTTPQPGDAALVVAKANLQILHLPQNTRTDPAKLCLIGYLSEGEAGIVMRSWGRFRTHRKPEQQATSPRYVEVNWRGVANPSDALRAEIATVVAKTIASFPKLSKRAKWYLQTRTDKALRDAGHTIKS
ncbi:MAG: hypothetical protein K0U36_02880 [Alphaproteobacteria bacterium]|nr:hypothetical protein [Alphaproteobacteria bacterium]